MAVVIGIPTSADPAERRTTIVPDVVKKLRASGAEIVVQRGATDGAYLDESSLGEVSWVDSTDDVLAAADVVWLIGPPDASRTAYFEARDELAWDWRFRDVFHDPARFIVLFDASAGTVRSTLILREYQNRWRFP